MNYYRITNLVLAIDNDKLTLQKELEDFKISAPDKEADINISFDYSGEDLLYVFEFKHGETWIITTPLLNIFEKPESFVIIYKNPKLVYGYEVFKQRNEAIIYIKSDDIGRYDTYDVELTKHDSPDIATGAELLLYSVRDSFFFHAQKFGCIPIHSASILYKDKVYMFSASSGVGKTTHVSLWQKAGIDHQIFNGDVCLAYIENGTVYAGALPWSGTSDNYTTCDTPLGGIIFLHQNTFNEITRLGNADGAINMCARCLAPNWNRKLVSDNMDIIERMIPHIVTASLQCNISTEAALTVRDFLEDII